MKAQLNVGNIFGTVLKTVKSQIWILVGLLVAYLIFCFTISNTTNPIFGYTETVTEITTETITDPLTGTIKEFIRTNTSSSNKLAYIVNLIISIIFILGYTKNIFQALDGFKPQISAYAAQARKLLIYLGATIIYSLIILLGFILFVLPGIYLTIRLQYYIAFIVEEDAKVMDSLKRSWKITKGHTGFLLLLFFTNIGLMVVGTLSFLIGLFVAIPVVTGMYCESYRKLNPIKSEIENEDAISK